MDGWGKGGGYSHILFVALSALGKVEFLQGFVCFRIVLRERNPLLNPPQCASQGLTRVLSLRQLHCDSFV